MQTIVHLMIKQKHIYNLFDNISYDEERRKINIKNKQSVNWEKNYFLCLKSLMRL